MSLLDPFEPMTEAEEDARHDKHVAMTIMDLQPTIRSMLRAGGGKTPPEWIAALSDVAAKLVPHYQMTGDEVAHLMAQIASETGGLSLTPPIESYQYSAKRAAHIFAYRLNLARTRGVFPAHYSLARMAGELAYSPRLFDVVYANRMGNGGPATGDGSRFRGRGLTQITGRSNYAAIHAEIQKQPGGNRCPNLLENPDGLLEPEWGCRAAFADWHIKGMGRFVEGRADDYKRVSAMLNAGNPAKWNLVNGKQHRAKWTRYAFYAFSPEIRLSIDALGTPMAPPVADMRVSEAEPSRKIVAKQSKTYKVAGAGKAAAGTVVLGAGTAEAVQELGIVSQGAGTVKALMDTTASIASSYGLVIVAVIGVAAFFVFQFIQDRRVQEHEEGRYETEDEA